MLTQKQVSEETHGRHIESAAGRGFATSPANSQAAEHLISPIVPIQPFVKPAFVQGGLLPVSASSANNQQTLGDIALLTWPFTSTRGFPRRFSELAVFDARFYLGVRCVDEPG